MKKKKRGDPMILLNREIRRKAKLEKSIKKLENKGRIPKFIEEIHGNRQFSKTAE